MNIDYFTEKKPGRLIKTPQGYWAFVPAPLPPFIDLNLDLILHLSNADRALGMLAGRANDLPNPHLLISPFIRREAVHSSRIEGTQASLTDLFYFEASSGNEKPTPDVVEVANYVRALEIAFRRISELPISLRLFREIHSCLMEGVRGGHLTPGEFRSSQNWIGPPGCTLNDATFVPPPVAEMNESLGEFENFLHSEVNIPSLLRLALIHYQFEAIHPFLDGNGRIGRLILTLLMCTEKLLPKPLLYLSVFFERNRDEYYRRLLAVSQRGEWNEWFLFFIRGVEEQSHDAFGRSQSLIKLWNHYRSQMQMTRSSAIMLKLVDLLFSSPVVTSRTVSEYLKVTPATAYKCIDRLMTKGILREMTERKRNKVYLAREIIQIVDAP